MGNDVEIEMTERVASGLFKMAAEMRKLGVLGEYVSALEMVADSLDSDRDDLKMQAIAWEMVSAIG